MKNTDTKRVAEIDSIRGIAALMIVFYHYTIRYQKLFESRVTFPEWLCIGRYGIGVFFIISGFGIFYSLEHLSSLRSFWEKRFWRLYPTYWLCLFLTAAAVAAGLPERQVTLREFVINLSMIQYGLQVTAVDSASWTLFFELLFYAHISVIWLLKLQHEMQYVALAWVAGALLNILYPVKILAVLLDYKYGMLFLAGIGFYHLYYRIGSKILWIAITAVCCALNIRQGGTHPLSANLLIFGVFYCVAFRKLFRLRSAFLAEVGALSYALYLLHQNIGYAIIKNVTARWGWNPLCAASLAFAVVLLLAWLIHHYFEKRLLPVWSRHVNDRIDRMIEASRGAFRRHRS